MGYEVLVMGASYGSLLGAKLLLAGHNVTLVGLPAEVDLFNREGARVRLPTLKKVAHMSLRADRQSACCQSRACILPSARYRSAARERSGAVPEHCVGDRHGVSVARSAFTQGPRRGEVAEWLKAHAWNACIRATVSRVRIPLSPPDIYVSN